MSLFMDGKDLNQFVRVIPDHQIGVDQFLVVIKEIGGAGESPCLPQVKKNGAAAEKRLEITAETGGEILLIIRQKLLLAPGPLQKGLGNSTSPVADCGVARL